MTLPKIDAIQDERFMHAALRLARQHQGLTSTNPSVACVIVNDLGHGPVIVGSAVTALGGRPHAEPPALEAAGEHAKGAIAYVTLEPCAHHGRTPPCAQTLIDAGVSRVVTAVTDPDQRVNGKGHQMLLDAGIIVDTLDGGVFAERVMDAYLKARSGYLPFVTLKLAMTEAGVMGERNRANMRISCSASFTQTHIARARHHAILVGSGTLTIDDPNLTCRLPGMEERSPVRVILDQKFEARPDHQCVAATNGAPTWLIAPADPPKAWRDMVKNSGVLHIPCEMENGHIALTELLQDLAARGIQSIMVEGGAGIAKGFLDEDLVDEIIVHVGTNPEKLHNEADAICAPFTPDAPPKGFEIVQSLQFGDDISLRMKKKG